MAMAELARCSLDAGLSGEKCRGRGGKREAPSGELLCQLGCGTGEYEFFKAVEFGFRVRRLLKVRAVQSPG